MSRSRRPAGPLPAVDARIDRPQPGGGAVPPATAPTHDPVEDVMRLRRTPGLHVHDESRPYPDHAGELVRVYLTIHLDPTSGGHPARASVPGMGGGGERLL